MGLKGKQIKKTNIERSGADFEALSSAQTSTAKEEWLEKFARGYMCISDALMNRDRGGYLALQKIEKTAQEGGINPDTGQRDDTIRCTWTLKVLVHRDGSKPKPGDEIEWLKERFHKSAKKEGRPLTVQEIENYRRRGELDRIENWLTLKLDKNCCIRVSYIDAVDMLNKHGVYYATGVAISAKPEKEMGGDEHGRPCDVYNWRFMEVPPWARDKLLADEEAPQPAQPAQVQQNRGR